MSVNSEPSPGVIQGRSAESLFRAHAGWLASIVRSRFGDAISPDDLVQEAYLRLPAGETLRHPRAFLLKVASRLATDQLRRQRRAQAYAEAHAPEGEVALGHQHERLILKELLDGLPIICRETFILSRFGGLSYEEIARRQGVSVKAVEWRISKALAYCTAQLDV